jgi:hypothetical protein
MEPNEVSKHRTLGAPPFDPATQLISLADLLRVLEDAYHPQNPTDAHPADVVWRAFGQEPRREVVSLSERDCALKQCPICKVEWPHHHERCAMVANVRDLEAARDRLREALAFYADEGNYDGFAPVECRVADDGEDGGCEYDKGRIARAALRETGRR